MNSSFMFDDIVHISCSMKLFMLHDVSIPLLLLANKYVFGVAIETTLP